MFGKKTLPFFHAIHWNNFVLWKKVLGLKAMVSSVGWVQGCDQQAAMMASFGRNKKFNRLGFFVLVWFDLCSDYYMWTAKPWFCLNLNLQVFPLAERRLPMLEWNVGIGVPRAGRWWKMLSCICSFMLKRGGWSQKCNQCTSSCSMFNSWVNITISRK